MDGSISGMQGKRLYLRPIHDFVVIFIHRFYVASNVDFSCKTQKILKMWQCSLKTRKR